jgi:Putative Ig domain
MRKLFLLILVFPFLVLLAPPAHAACTVTTTELPNGTVGTGYANFIDVADCGSSDKDPSFRVVEGKLPTGTKLFDFAGSSGLISGTPKVAGSFTFTVQVKGADRTIDTQQFTVVIEPAEEPTITTPGFSDGTVGAFYCCGNLFADGGVPPYTWSIVSGELPPGLELPRRDNTISGTPTVAGTFTFTVQVTDDIGGTDQETFSITINN